MVRYCITPEGRIGEPFLEEADSEEVKEEKKAFDFSFLEEDEEDGYDVPDVSQDFMRLREGVSDGKRKETPPTADFELNDDGTATLLRWPRMKGAAFLPETIDGHILVSIGATAFAAGHLDEELLDEMYSDATVSYSMYCMKMARYMSYESTDEGGPTEVHIPQSVKRIGAYAFWRCRNLKEIELPDGIEKLPAGVFGECSGLEKVHLPCALLEIGYMPGTTQIIMPDVGTFAGCHSLKTVRIPGSVAGIGAEVFNSAGIVHIQAEDSGEMGWGRHMDVDESAFHHTPALLWMDKVNRREEILYRIGLPVARDKILPGDSKFGVIQRIPVDFFSKPAVFFDALAWDAFRIDFSARMALARLEYNRELTKENEAKYLDVLVDNYDKAEQFMPEYENAFEFLFDFLKKQEHLTSAHVSALLRHAAYLGLSAEMISRMMELRNKRFGTLTGFEDLDVL